MQVRAKTAFVAGGFGAFSEGDEFEIPDTAAEAAAEMIRVGHVEPVTPEPEHAVSPKQDKAERAVRFGRRG